MYTHWIKNSLRESAREREEGKGLSACNECITRGRCRIIRGFVVDLRRSECRGRVSGVFPVILSLYSRRPEYSRQYAFPSNACVTTKKLSLVWKIIRTILIQIDYVLITTLLLDSWYYVSKNRKTGRFIRLLMMLDPRCITEHIHSYQPSSFTPVNRNNS